MPWESGTKIFGDRYKIIKILGQGGFGITYLVENSQGSTLVLKTVKDEILIDRRYSNRRDKYLLEFEKEASKLAICRHHHIVKIDNHFSVNYSIEGNNNSWNGSLPCIVMEYIAGKDLLDLVEEEGKLSEVEAVSYIQQIGDALKLIHSKGLLHRDIKPHNIMKRDNKQEVVLIDFGIARQFIPNINQVMTTFATDGFAPVEQYDEYGRKGEYTDIYALSATLYYLLTKKIPRTSLLRRKDKKWDKLKPLNKIISVSDRVHEAVMKGLAIEPEDRPQNLKEWLEMFVSKDIIYLHNQQLQKNNFTNLQEKEEVISEIDLDIITLPIKYKKLQLLLANEEWKKADQETTKIMLRIAQREIAGWFNIDSIENFPCEDLFIIDKLWLRYSNGQFGFSVQKDIWLKCGGKVGYYTEKKLGDRLGWRKNGEWIDYDQLIFSTLAPIGQFPRVWCGLFHWGMGCRFTKAILNCNQYQKLEQLLANHQWKEANQETVKIMLKIVDREKEGWFDSESIDNFPVKELKAIDRLWIRYSNGHFGFSIQKNIWLECGSKGDYETEKKLADRLGWIIDGEWINYDDQVTFNISAPLGHLPFKYGYYGKVGGVLDPVWILWIQENLES